MENGDNKNAIENYKKSLELDPTNQNAKKMIEKLTLINSYVTNTKWCTANFIHCYEVV